MEDEIYFKKVLKDGKKEPYTISANERDSVHSSLNYLCASVSLHDCTSEITEPFSGGEKSEFMRFDQRCNKNAFHLSGIVKC